MRVHHVAFRTRDLARLERFYVDVLGFTVTTRTTSVWLECGETIVMLEQADDSEPSPDPRSMDLVAFAIDPGQGTTWSDRLARAAIAIEGRTNFSLYVRDPDGRRIGLSSYPKPL